jgi:hypothetical protein
VGREARREIRGDVAHEAQVDAQRRAGATAAAALRPEVGRRGRVAEPVGIRVEPEASPQDRPPALELRDREKHPLSKERAEGALQTLGADQALEVAVRAARVPEQRAIRACRVCVHGAADERKEVGLPLGVTTPEDGPRLGRADRGSEKTRELREEPRPQRRV